MVIVVIAVVVTVVSDIVIVIVGIVVIGVGNNIQYKNNGHNCGSLYNKRQV